MNSNNQPFYECEYCSKKIASLHNFEKHECEKAKRFKLCRTKKGLNAFTDYAYWLSTKGKTIKKIQTFIDSRFFNSFIQFQEFCSTKGIPDKKLYISKMIEWDVTPMLWCNKDFYNKFIVYFDDDVPVDQKVSLTLKTLFHLSKIF
jgi:hypothetical protein